MSSRLRDAHERAPRRVSLIALRLCAVLAASPDAPAAAGDLADLLRSESLKGLEIAPIASALADTVASTYPVASASASVVYTFDPELGTFERQGGVPAPVMGERAETIGPRQVGMGMTYSYVRLTSINGRDLDALVNQPRLGNRVVSVSFPEGVRLKDGRRTTFVPARVRLDLGVDAHIMTPTMTYGITQDLDLNLAVPLVRSALRATARSEVPDPRFPEFALCPVSPACPNNPRPGTNSVAVGGDAFGIGDVLLRAKYVLSRGRPVSLAAGLALSLPSGSPGDFHGSGSTRIQPSLIVSRTIANRLESLLNIGVDVNADDIGRSVVRWSAEATSQFWGPVAPSLGFLGRHELAAQTAKIAHPFFFQIERNDIIDAAFSVRYRFAEGGFIVGTAAVPLNDDGLRAEVIPTAQVEYQF